MLERFALSAAFDEFAKRVSFGFAQRALEVQIQLHARNLQDVREQQLGLQPWRVDIFFGQEFRAFLNALKDRHCEQCMKGEASVRSFFFDVNQLGMDWTRNLSLTTIDLSSASWLTNFMKVDYPIVGGGLLASFGVAIWRGFLWSNLRRKSLRLTIDEKTHVELRTSVWAYVLPLFGLGLGAILWRGAVDQRSNVAFSICLVISLLMVCGSIYVMRVFARARLTVTGDRIIYVDEGKTREIEASEVLGVEVIGYYDLRIHLRWDQHVNVPATFHRSEFIFAFLRQAVIKNRQVDSSVPIPQMRLE
jgi:hypothetical protein